MNEKQKQELAESLDATPALLPFIPELLADIWVLGSSSEVVVDLLRSLGLPRNLTRVLDLGCGKGAIAIPLAQELGFQVLGVDLFQPFIQEARERAEKLGITSLCQFEIADMHETLSKVRDFDVVIFAAVGGVLGRFDHCIRKLRQSIRPGGYMIIDDGFLAENTKLKKLGYENYAPHDETLRQLTAHGDTLLSEVLIPVEKIREYNQKNTESIRKRAEKLSQRHPEAANSFSWYVEQQERECEILETAVVGAVWLLQRT